MSAVPGPSPDWPCLTLTPDTAKVCTLDAAHDTDHAAHGPDGEVTATWPRAATDRTAMEHEAAHAPTYHEDAVSVFGSPTQHATHDDADPGNVLPAGSTYAGTLAPGVTLWSSPAEAGAR